MLLKELYTPVLVSLLSVNKSVQFLVCLLQIIVDKDLIELGRSRPCKLVLRTGEALLDALLSFSAATTESFLELLSIRGRDKDVARVDGRGLDLLDTLHLDVEDDHLALSGLLLDSRLACSV